MRLRQRCGRNIHHHRGCRPGDHFGTDQLRQAGLGFVRCTERAGAGHHGCCSLPVCCLRYICSCSSEPRRLASAQRLWVTHGTPRLPQPTPADAAWWLRNVSWLCGQCRKAARRGLASAADGLLPCCCRPLGQRQQPPTHSASAVCVLHFTLQLTLATCCHHGNPEGRWVVAAVASGGSSQRNHWVCPCRPYEHPQLQHGCSVPPDGDAQQACRSEQALAWRHVH